MASLSCSLVLVRDRLLTHWTHLNALLEAAGLRGRNAIP